MQKGKKTTRFKSSGHSIPFTILAIIRKGNLSGRLLESSPPPLKIRIKGCRYLCSSSRISPFSQMGNPLREPPQCSLDSKWQKEIDLSKNGICWSLDTEHPRSKHGFRWGWTQSSNSTFHGHPPPLSWIPSQNLTCTEHNMAVPAPASVRAEMPPSVPKVLQYPTGSGRVMWPSLVGASGLRWLNDGHMPTTGPSFHPSNKGVEGGGLLPKYRRVNLENQ